MGLLKVLLMICFMVLLVVLFILLDVLLLHLSIIVKLQLQYPLFNELINIRFIIFYHLGL